MDETQGNTIWVTIVAQSRSILMSLRLLITSVNLFVLFSAIHYDIEVLGSHKGNSGHMAIVSRI